jgi:thymidylate synthase (FAD)
MTPFEMVEYKFRIKAPVLVWWQFVRHRTFSFNAQSGRYTPFQEDDFYIPEVWRLQSKDNKQGSDGFLNLESKESQHLFDQLENNYNFSYCMYN